MTLQNMDPLGWMMAWYRSQCDGDWEHQNGIRIGTIDNPGWSLDVDLSETPQAGSSVPQKLIERSNENWIFVEIKDGVFRARGGPCNLSEMINLFAAFVEGEMILD